MIQELEVMKMLEPHPNVVRLLGCCTEKGIAPGNLIKIIAMGNKPFDCLSRTISIAVHFFDERFKDGL